MPNVSVQSRTIEPAQQKGRGASGVAFPRRAWERVDTTEIQRRRNRRFSRSRIRHGRELILPSIKRGRGCVKNRLHTPFYPLVPMLCVGTE